MAPRDEPRLPDGYAMHLWTSEEVARFWDFVAKVQPEAYFTRQVGSELVVHFRPLIGEARAIVDFGCGLGFFLEALGPLARRMHGFDLSPASLVATRERMRGVASFAGAFGLEAVAEHQAAFDLGFCLEVVEHLDDRELAIALESMRGMLAPGGRLVVSTPNEEDLSQSWVLMPETGRIIHRWQHVRSWSAASLTAALAGAGFRVERAYAADAAALGAQPKALARRLANGVLGRKPPNLFAIAIRP